VIAAPAIFVPDSSGWFKSRPAINLNKKPTARGSWDLLAPQVMFELLLVLKTKKPQAGRLGAW
jgi:hypothetical protein